MTPGPAASLITLALYLDVPAGLSRARNFSTRRGELSSARRCVAARVAVTMRAVGGVGSGSATPEKVDAAELAVLLAAGTSVAAIAVLFGCTDRTVRNTATRHGLVVPLQRRGRTSQPRVERRSRYPQLYAPGWLQERCTAGVPLRTVAAEAGCSVTTVRSVADRLGVVRRRRAPPRPQLCDVAWLRQAYLERGLSLEGIARAVGASDSAVSQGLARADVPTRRIRRQPRLADADWLRSVYLDDGLAAPAIAERLGVHENTVYKALERAGVPRRRGGGRPSRWLTDAAWLRGQYVDADRTAASIADEVGRSPSTVKQALARHGIHKPPPPRPSERQLIEDWGSRRSITALARSYRASRGRTEVWLAEVGIFLLARPQLARRAVRARLRRGDDVPTTARQFGISPQRMTVELLQHGLAPPTERS